MGDEIREIKMVIRSLEERMLEAERKIEWIEHNRKMVFPKPPAVVSVDITVMRDVAKVSHE